MDQHKQPAPLTREDLSPEFGLGEYITALRLRAGLSTDALRELVGAPRQMGYQCPIETFEAWNKPHYDFLGRPPFDYTKVPGVNYELLAEAARNEHLPGWRGDVRGNIRLAYIRMRQCAENGDLTEEKALRILAVLDAAGKA